MLVGRIAVVGAAIVMMAACARSDPLLPDIEYSLDCSELPSRSNGIAVENALFSAGFEVLNGSRLAKELHMRIGTPASIDAIERRGHIISVRGRYAHLPGQEASQRAFLTFSLYSQPSGFENAQMDALLRSLSNQLPMCSVTKVKRHRGAASDERAYEIKAKDVWDKLERARVAAPGSDTYRRH